MAKIKTFWTCPNCHEQVEDHFEACWNCQHNRHGVLVEDLSSSEERPETPIPTDEVPTGICLRCQTNMTYAGKKEFHEGMRWGMIGDIGELFVNHTKLELYFCPAAGTWSFSCEEPNSHSCL